MSKQLREALHEARVGCTWDEQIPKQRMCNPSWHEDSAARLRALSATPSAQPEGLTQDDLRRAHQRIIGGHFPETSFRCDACRLIRALTASPEPVPPREETP